MDSSRLEQVDGFARKTDTAMIEGIRGATIARGLMDAQTFAARVRALNRTTETLTARSYTFFKAVGIVS